MPIPSPSSGLFERLRIASEDNRRLRAGLPRSVQIVHVLLAPLIVIIAFLRAPPRIDWAWPLALGLLGFVVFWPWDARISELGVAASRGMGGDLRRELHAWQQFGAGGSLAFTALVIMLSDPRRSRRLLDLLLALAVGGVIGPGMKMLIGRPRPRELFDDPTTFLGPTGLYPIPDPSQAASLNAAGEVGGWKLVHAWDTSAGANADLWSIPSTHAMYAVILTVFLSAMYPRLRVLWIALAALVSVCRLIFDAHWATDVIVGAALGAAVAQPIIHRYAGVRLLDWLWKHLVDRTAAPAYPALRARFSSAGNR